MLSYWIDFLYTYYLILIRNNVTNTTKIITIYTHLILQAILQDNIMQSCKHSKEKRCLLILHAIKLYKTDLGAGSLYLGLCRRVNGEKRWSLEYLVVTYAGFYFWNVGTQRTTHQELYKVYFNGMFMIYLFIFWRKNRNISIKCHNRTYFHDWDLKCMNINAI